jgi:hypothetical protein
MRRRECAPRRWPVVAASFDEIARAGTDGNGVANRRRATPRDLNDSLKCGLGPVAIAFQFLEQSLLVVPCSYFTERSRAYVELL